jgi:hypothetical protein
MTNETQQQQQQQSQQSDEEDGEDEEGQEQQQQQQSPRTRERMREAEREKNKQLSALAQNSTLADAVLHSPLNEPVKRKKKKSKKVKMKVLQTELNIQQVCFDYFVPWRFSFLFDSVFFIYLLFGDACSVSHNIFSSHIFQCSSRKKKQQVSLSRT